MAISLVAPAIVGAGAGPMVRGHRRGPARRRRPLAELFIARDANSQVINLRQNFRRTGGHFDQQPDTAAALDHQPKAAPTRKHESRFDGCLF